MDRRSFFGRVIGVLAATQIPFRAEAVEMPRRLSGELRRVKALVRLFELSRAELLKCRVYGVTSEAERFWAPAIKDVEIDMANSKATFVAEAVNMTCAMQCVGVGLFDDRGIWLREMKCSPINVISGDQLNMTYALKIDW